MEMRIKFLYEFINKDSIIRLCLEKVDALNHHIVEHGERITFLAAQIFDALEETTMNRDTLLLLCLFHEIGAYRIRKITTQEREQKMHCVYGYLVFKYFSSWPNYSEMIYYHHAGYKELEQKNIPNKEYAAFIYLLDQVNKEILAQVDQETLFKRIRVSDCDPKHLVAFERAMKQKDLYLMTKQITREEIREIVLKQINMSDEDAIQLLRLLARSIDFKKGVTLEHSMSTATIAVCLASQMKLPEIEIEKIFLGALVHDIGKLNISTTILEKTSKLSADEMSIMKEHVKFTEELLLPILPLDIIQIATAHHEKLDGSGYPYGLKAEQINLQQRIVAVADLISALVSKRSYKRPKSLEDTLLILQQMAQEGLIDKEVVKCAMKSKEILKEQLKKQYKALQMTYQMFVKEYQEFCTSGKIWIEN